MRPFIPQPVSLRKTHQFWRSASNRNQHMALNHLSLPLSIRASNLQVEGRHVAGASHINRLGIRGCGCEADGELRTFNHPLSNTITIRPILMSDWFIRRYTRAITCKIRVKVEPREIQPITVKSDPNSNQILRFRLCLLPTRASRTSLTNAARKQHANNSQQRASCNVAGHTV